MAFNPRAFAFFAGFTFVTTGVDANADYNTIIKVNAPSVTITLPDPALATVKSQAIVITGEERVTVKRFGAENIQGQTFDKTLKKYHTFYLVSDGTDWWLI